MSVSPSAPLEHLGPWTEEDFLGLPTKPRIELLGGSLLVSPLGSVLHQWLSFQICARLNAAAPRGMRALEVNVRVAQDKILIPDVAVMVDPDMSAAVVDAASVRLVVEISSPSNEFMDRGVKPALYAAAGIERYLRVELGADGPIGHLYILAGDRYLEQPPVPPGEPVVLDAPFPVRFDLAELIGSE